MKSVILEENIPSNIFMYKEKQVIGLTWVKVISY